MFNFLQLRIKSQFISAKIDKYLSEIVEFDFMYSWLIYWLIPKKNIMLPSNAEVVNLDYMFKKWFYYGYLIDLDLDVEDEYEMKPSYKCSGVSEQYKIVLKYLSLFVSIVSTYDTRGIKVDDVVTFQYKKQQHLVKINLSRVYNFFYINLTQHNPKHFYILTSFNYHSIIGFYTKKNINKNLIFIINTIQLLIMLRVIFNIQKTILVLKANHVLFKLNFFRHILALLSFFKKRNSLLDNYIVFNKPNYKHLKVITKKIKAIKKSRKKLLYGYLRNNKI